MSVAAGEARMSRSPGLLAGMRRLFSGRLFPWAFACVFFLAAAIVQTWPLILHINDSIADSPAAPIPDTYQFIWNLSWVKQSIVDLQTNPFHTDYLFHPDGEDLYLHTLAFVNGLLSIPLQVTTGNLILSWNILALLFFVLSGVSTYAVARHVTGNHWAAVMAGFIFAFAPVVMMQFNGRWHISTTWPIPLMALFAIRYLGTKRLWDAAGAGVCWALLLYNNQEFALDAALFLALLFVYCSAVYLRRRDTGDLKSLWLGGAVIIGVWVVLAAPLVIPAVIDARSGDYHLPAGDEYYSADLLSFVTPSPLWGSGKDPTGFDPDHDPIGSIENTLYLGGVPLLLAAISVLTFRRSPHTAGFWLLLMLVFVVLSLGPRLYVDGEKLFDFPMPYELYDQLPMFGDRRVPARMLPFGMLGLAVASAVGLDYLMSKLRARQLASLAPVVAILAIGVVGLEYWNPPVHTTQLDPPDALEQIRDDDGGDFSVLEVPLGRRAGWGFNGHLNGSAIAAYYQTVHHKRVFGGFVARIKEATLAWLGTEPGIQHVALPSQPPSERDLDANAVRDMLRRYDVKYVVLHRIGPHGQPIDSPEILDSLDRYIRRVMGLREIASDPSLTIYINEQLEEAAAAPD